MENVTWIKDLLYVLPLLALVWKGASMANQIKQNTKDIEDLKSVVKEQNSNIIESLDRINNTMLSIKCDVEILKAYRKQECTTSTESQTK